MHMLFGQDENVSCLAVNMKNRNPDQLEDAIYQALKLIPQERSVWDFRKFGSIINTHLIILVMCRNENIKNSVTVYSDKDFDDARGHFDREQSFILEYNDYYTIVTYE